MKATTPRNDPLWPRARAWLAPSSGEEGPQVGLGVLGVPAHQTSITPTNAHMTPAAIRDALARYSTFATDGGLDLTQLAAADFGDVDSPDGPAGEERVRETVHAAAERCELLLALGGDNSLTYSVMAGLFETLADVGLVTLDAHHDLRDGATNGSPVRRLLEAGLPGRNVVQVGIADFSNSPAYAARAREHEITVIGRSELREASPAGVVARALAIAGAGGRPVFVDIDVDVCDRAAVPGCPSAAPGGISADELRQYARLFAADTRVRGMDITEIDAGSDAIDQRTVRLGALLVLEIAAGLLTRTGA